MSWLLDRSSVVRLERSPISGGIVPVSWLVRSESPVTRPPDTATPNHVETALAVSQLLLSVQLVPSVLTYSAINASHSICGTPVVTVAEQSTCA